MFYEVVYNRESPSRITGKSSFYKVVIRYIWTYVYSSLYGIYYCVKGTLCDIKTISKTRLFPSSFFAINLSHFHQINLLVVYRFINPPYLLAWCVLCCILVYLYWARIYNLCLYRVKFININTQPIRLYICLKMTNN